MDDEIVSESMDKYICNNCNYVTQHKSNYFKHCSTAKHIQRTMDDKKVSDYICSCGKNFKYRQGLHKHKIKCSPDQNKNIIIENPIKDVGRFAKESLRDSRLGSFGTPTEPPGGAKRRFSIDSPNGLSTENTNNVIDMNLVLELIKQNKELQNLLVQQSNEHKTMLVQQSNENKTMFVQQSKENSELVNKLIEREPGGNTINSNNTINNNQKFNLNFFLNETCKDAMSIQEFLANIRITFDDLLTIGNTGFVNGVSDIFIRQLRDLEVNKRPIHCTDSKRETIYFKEEDVWNKDDKEKTRLKQLIEKVEYRNVVALRDWCNENPDAKVNNTPNNILKDKIYLQTLQGDDKTRDKIIKNISREVTVDKENITNNLIT